MVHDFLILQDKSILFAEDDIISRMKTEEILTLLFKEVYSVQNGEEAYKLYKDKTPDIILTDINMPTKDGLEFIEGIRKDDYTTPIVVVTSFSEKGTLIRATNLAIDGYLLKPINLNDLTFTLRRAIQRTHKDKGILSLSKNLFFNFDTKELYLNNDIVTLGTKEQELLLLLLNNRERTVTKEEIENALWPIDTVSASAIKKLILRIRKKIKIDIISSQRGIGYRLETREIKR